MAQPVRTSIRSDRPRRTRVVALAAAVAGVMSVAAVSLPAAAASRPSAPSGLAAASSAAGTFLKWDSPVVTSFVIQQATNSAFSTDVHKYTVRGFASGYSPTGLNPGSQYWFRVQAVEDSASSGWSNKAQVVAVPNESALRVLSYNSLQIGQDGKTR